MLFTVQLSIIVISSTESELNWAAKYREGHWILKTHSNSVYFGDLIPRAHVSFKKMVVEFRHPARELQGIYILGFNIGKFSSLINKEEQEEKQELQKVLLDLINIKIMINRGSQNLEVSKCKLGVYWIYPRPQPWVWRRIGVLHPQWSVQWMPHIYPEGHVGLYIIHSKLHFCHDWTLNCLLKGTENVNKFVLWDNEFTMCTVSNGQQKEYCNRRC